MAIEIKVPVLPESVTDATIAAWHKNPGEPIKRDEPLVDIETDKVVLEVVAPEEGSLASILKPVGTTVNAQEVIGLFKAGVAFRVSQATAAKDDVNKSNETTSNTTFSSNTHKTEAGISATNIPVESSAALSPAQRRQLKTTEMQETSKGQVATNKNEPSASNSKLIGKGKQNSQPIQSPNTKKITDEESIVFPIGGRVEKRVPMTRLRARIAERLIEVQKTAAILTTFNEINMQPIMLLRQKYKEIFEKTYGVRLGFMSFFTMAAVEALKHFPIINASIDGNEIVYHGYYDIGIAVSSPRGLVVPIIRNAETLSMSEIEKKLGEYSEKAQNGQLDIQDITGGTFTISNGGVFGSLMSTPILNPPQSAILGMHKIQERVIVENGQMVIRPMMYVALSYDHRVIDGKDAVQFLVTMKELLEDPARLALGI